MKHYILNALKIIISVMIILGSAASINTHIKIDKIVNAQTFSTYATDEESEQESLKIENLISTRLGSVLDMVKIDNVSTETEKVPNYSSDDLYCLAVAVYTEAGGESDEAQLLVANVVMNRVTSSLFPDTVRDVLTQYRQYGLLWKNGVYFPSNATTESIDRSYDIAKRVLDGERFCPQNVVFQAEFKQGNGVYKQIGNIYFCYYGELEEDEI